MSEKKLMKRHSNYWFPIVIPFLIGLLIPLIQTQNDIIKQKGLFECNIDEAHKHTQTDQILGTELEKKNKERIIKLFTEIFRSTITALVSLDIWALTILFTTTSTQVRHCYAPPIISLILRFCCLIIAFLLPHLFDETLHRYICEACILLGNFVLAIWVREKIWKYIDGNENFCLEVF